MPEPIRNRFQNASTARDGDYTEAARTRPGFGADEDPLAELARIVGETTQIPYPSSQSTARREPVISWRDYPRRDTSWRDPQAQTTVVRAGITPKPMPGQLADLEAELFNEVRSENLRQLPPAPDLAQLGLPDARMSAYPAPPVTAPGQSGQVRQPVRPAPNDFTAQGGAHSGVDLDDEVTLPMHSVLRATPPSARVSEGNGMQQPPRFNPAPVQQPPQVAQHDEYGDQAHYGAHEDYDPAGAFGGEQHYGYEDPAAAYYAELEHHLGQPQSAAHAPVGGPGYPPIQAQHAEHGDFNAHYEDEGDAYGYPQQVPPRSNRRPQSSGISPLMLGAAAIVGVLVLGTGSVFAYRAMSTGGITGSGVPLIKADTKPMKETVAQQPIANAPGPNLDVARADNQDKLVTQAEDPVDKIPVKPVRLVGTGTGLQNASLAPVQRVRSVIVRPDGSIVTPDDTGAKPTPLVQPIRTASIQTTTDAPVTTPPAPVQTQPIQAAPVQPMAAQSPPALPPLNPVTNIQTAPVVAKPAPAPIIAAPKPAVVQSPVAQVQQPPVIRPVKTTPMPHIQPTAPEAPIALAPAQPPVRVATITPPTAPSTHSAPIETGTGDYVVQISSARSEAEANSALKAAVQKYASIGARPGDVQQADLGARGKYYRARLAGGTHEQAQALCAQIKSQGGDCVVSKR